MMIDDYDALDHILEKYDLSLNDDQKTTFLSCVNENAQYQGDIGELWGVVHSNTKVKLDLETFIKFSKEPYIAMLITMSQNLGIHRIRKKFFSVAVESTKNEGKEELHTLAHLYLNISKNIPSADTTINLDGMDDATLQDIVASLTGKRPTREIVG